MIRIEKVILCFFTLIIASNVFLVFFGTQEELLIYFEIEKQQYIDTIVILSLFGVHAFFGILTMFLTNTGQKFKYRFLSLWGTIFGPCVFFIYNFKTMLSYQTDSDYFFYLMLLFFYYVHKNRNSVENLFRVYVKTLVNPLDVLPH
jgi:hypothetical protein